MKPFSKLGFLHLTRLSKPVADRAIYRMVRKQSFRSIVEVGLGDGTRCLNLIRLANQFCGQPVRYTGIDLFEARDPSQPPLKLIEMHKVLKATPAKVQLVPGELGSALVRIANSHLRTDLVIVSFGYDSEALDQSIRFVPRMLHSGSQFLIQRAPEQEFESLNRLEIERWAEESTDSVAKAA